MPHQPDAPDEHDDVPPKGAEVPDRDAPAGGTVAPDEDVPPGRDAPADTPADTPATTDGTVAPGDGVPPDAPATPFAPAQSGWPPPAGGPAGPGGSAAAEDYVVPAPPRDTAPPDQPGAGIRPAPQAGGRGPGVGAGVGLGCAAHVIAFPLMVLSLMSAAGIWGALWPFYVIGVAAIVGMFFESSRKVSTGVLIVSAAAWIVLLGPCIAVVGG
ncbi:hypothetical protein [Microbacterium sp. B19]|uniref:hypothetical protein n=1 Tax=Microbacterium sp. B19 TaxID=96765 RepID=UPI0011D2C778|nr:hypothetical protein [Microbacterium sp. B19]